MIKLWPGVSEIGGKGDKVMMRVTKNYLNGGTNSKTLAFV